MSRFDPPLDLCLTKARTRLLLDHPFFGTLLFRLTLVETTEVDTMATDGISIFYNRVFVEHLQPAELVGVLAHEVMHPALHHDTRRNGRDPELWNEACDYAINPVLLEAGLQLPPDGLLDSRFQGMCAEQIYNRLDEERDRETNSSRQGKQKDQGPSGKMQPAPSSRNHGPSAPKTPGGFGQVVDAPFPRDDKSKGVQHVQHKEAHERDWQVAVEQAEAVARLAGKSPAGLDRTLESGQDAGVDWREVLRRTFSETLPADYSWLRPNRRYVWQGIYFPGIVREGIGEIVIAVDCSGSISRRVLGFFQEEMSALVSEHLPERVHVLYFDTEIHRHDTWERGQSISLNPKGGGGTSFAPVFAYVEEHAITPHSLIVLTDLAGSFPSAAPAYPVIWASTRQGSAPFGAIVPLHAA